MDGPVLGFVVIFRNYRPFIPSSRVRALYRLAVVVVSGLGHCGAAKTKKKKKKDKTVLRLRSL